MTTTAEVEAVLKRRVEPLLSGHGGRLRLLGLRDGVACVELLGACAGCPSAELGTRDFIEEALRAELPEIRGVELSAPVSDELLDFARKMLRRGETP